MPGPHWVTRPTQHSDDKGSPVGRPRAAGMDGKQSDFCCSQLHRFCSYVRGLLPTVGG